MIFRTLRDYFRAASERTDRLADPSTLTASEIIRAHACTCRLDADAKKAAPPDPEGPGGAAVTGPGARRIV